MLAQPAWWLLRPLIAYAQAWVGMYRFILAVWAREYNFSSTATGGLEGNQGINPVCAPGPRRWGEKGRDNRDEV